MRPRILSRLAPEVLPAWRFNRLLWVHAQVHRVYNKLKVGLHLHMRPRRASHQRQPPGGIRRQSRIQRVRRALTGL